MDYTAPRSHPLHISRRNDSPIPHAVAMFNLPVQHIGDGFDPPVGVPGKSLLVVLRPPRAEIIEEEEGVDFKARLNPHSLEVLEHSRVEDCLRGARPLSRYQFLRQGYFCLDYDSTPERLVFNRTVTMKDTWAKIEQSQRKG